MRIHCFYHSADLDGQCSGAIVKYFIPETILHPINYGDEFPWDEIAPDDTVYMVDFCLQPAEDMQRLGASCKSIIWIDHHKTAIDSMAEAGIANMDGLQVIGFAGCELTWAYFRGDEDPPLAVTLLGRYDVWDHSDPLVLPFQCRLGLDDLDPLNGLVAMELWSGMFDKIGENAFIVDMATEGMLLLRYQEQQNNKVCKAYAFETTFPDPTPSALGAYTADDLMLNAVCLNIGMTNSKVFDSIYNPEKHKLMVTFCRLPIHKQSKGGWKVSLYSTWEDVDCGAIARFFGGGGHKGAAGFQCDTLPFKI